MRAIDIHIASTHSILLCYFFIHCSIIAQFRIPYYEKGHKINPEEINGIKLELFIFDAFYYSNNFLVYQVPAHEEFSPLKNPDSAGKDCFSTCVNAYKNTHWIRDACNFVLSEKEKNEAS